MSNCVNDVIYAKNLKTVLIGKNKNNLCKNFKIIKYTNIEMNEVEEFRNSFCEKIQKQLFQHDAIHL